MTSPLLSARNITVRFGTGLDRFDAVQRANLCLEQREIIGVVGESGSGKTTLARVLVGLQRPAAGEVFLQGKVIFGSQSTQRIPSAERWKIQMVFQDPYSSLNPHMRAWQAVAEALHVWRAMANPDAKREAFTLLDSLGISEDQAVLFPRSLSGGQRQRVSIARALAPQPRVLIADEPTSAIDQSAQAQLLNLLRQLQSERELAIVFISHDLSLVRYLTSRIYVMQKGLVVEEGDTGSVFQSPKHPYTGTLIDSIPGR